MKKFLVLLALLCVVPALVFAQAPVGKISGTVIDKTTGKPLPAANVIVEGTGRGAATDANGRYTILDMPPGWYDVTVSMMGYKPVTHTRVKVTMDLTTNLNFELEPTVIKIEKPIEVVAKRPIVERDVTTSVTYSTAEEIKAMPVTDFRAVVNLTPGVVAGHVRGGRGGEEVYMIDGIAIRDPYGGGFAGTVPLLAIQEQAVYTGGFGAEYAAESGVISVATKEPGPKLSGTIRYKTDDYSKMPKAIKEFGDTYNKEELQWRKVYDRAVDSTLYWYGYAPEMFHQGEFSLTGPIAGPLSFFVSGDIQTSKGRFRCYDENNNPLSPKNNARHTYLGRLMLKPIPTMKLKLGLYQSKHTWYAWNRFVPNNGVDRRDLDRLLSVNLTHLLSPEMFYDIKLSQHLYDEWGDRRGDKDEFGNDLNRDFPYIDSVKYWVDHVAPSFFYYPADWPDPRRRGQLAPYEIKKQDTLWIAIPEHPTLGRYRYHQETHTTTTGELNFTSQLTPMHEVKTGFMYKKYNLSYFHADVASGGNYYMEKHHTHPYSWAAYFRDKIEARGMVVNAGLRLDYFNSNTYYPANWSDPVTNPATGGQIKNPVKSKPRWQISPRLGISHPITDKDVLHFTYGHYFEVPRLYYLLRHAETWYMYGAFGLYGNPNMDVERTVSYEVGVEHAITHDFKIDVSGFFKDITGLATSKQYFRSATDWYNLYTNGDYGHSRGLEFTFKKRPTRAGLWAPISGTISYTFMVAKGRYSSAYAAYYAVWANQRLMTREHYLDWDERHTITANIDIRIPGIGTGINVVYNYGSGLPYTPTARDPYIQPINEARRPSTATTDIKLRQPFRIGTNYLMAFFDILNAFDKKNLTGRPADIQWYEQYNDPEGRYHNAGVWGWRRRIRTGIEFRF